MKMFQGLNQLKALLVFALAFGAVALINAPDALAATKTWTGGGSDDNWSTAANWSPSGAPVDGDDIVIGVDVNGSTLDVVNDISGLSVNSITWAGVWQDGVPTRIDTTAHVLNVTGDIDGGPSLIAGIKGGIELGDDISILGVTMGTYGVTTSHTIDLNGYELTFDASSSNGSLTVNQSIVGDGSVVYLVDVMLYEPNSYSGTTIIQTPEQSGVTEIDLTPSEMFGTSSITIKNGSKIQISFEEGAYTWSNPITIEASPDDLDWALFLYCVTETPGACTVTIPNITLVGNAAFASNDGIVANLAGFTANGFCLDYSYSGGVVNDGPPACQITPGSSVTSVPGAPNSGEMMRSPLVVVLASVAGLGAAGFAVKRGLAFAKARR